MESRSGLEIEPVSSSAGYGAKEGEHRLATTSHSKLLTPPFTVRLEVSNRQFQLFLSGSDFVGVDDFGRHHRVTLT